MMKEYGLRCLPYMAIMQLPTVLERIILEYCTPLFIFRIKYLDQHQHSASLIITDS